MALGIPGRLEGLRVLGKLQVPEDIVRLRVSEPKPLTLYPYYLTLST